MDICFIRHSVLNRGGDKIVLAHAAYLADQGHAVTITTNKIDTSFSIHSKIRILPIPFKSKVGTLLFCLLTKQRASLVIADIIVLACLLALRNGHRVVHFAQDYDESYYQSHAMKMLIRCFYYLGLHIIKMPTIAVSEELAGHLSNRFRVPVHVVPNGVDVRIFFPEPSPVLLQEKEGRKAILLFSRKDKRKGFDVARTVIAKLTCKCTVPFEVWTVGERAAGMIPGVHHRDFGFADEEHMRILFSSADVFLYPSRHEGFGLMVMESFACRCPVVTTQVVPFVKNCVNAMVSEEDDSDSLATHVHELLESSQLKGEIVDRAFSCALSNTMRISESLFENALQSIYSRQMLNPNACTRSV